MDYKSNIVKIVPLLLGSILLFFIGFAEEKNRTMEEELLLQFDVLKLKENNHIEFNRENSTIEYCKVNDENEIMLAGNDEWIAMDDLDFSLIEW